MCKCHYCGVACCEQLIGLCCSCCCCHTVVCCTSTVRQLKCVTYLSWSYFIHIFICGSNVATSAGHATTTVNNRKYPSTNIYSYASNMGSNFEPVLWHVSVEFNFKICFCRFFLVAGHTCNMWRERRQHVVLDNQKMESN